MNSKIKAFYESQGMTVDQDKAYGVVRGYETNASAATYSNDPTNYPYQIFISFYATKEQKQKMGDAISSAALKFFRFGFNECGLLFSYSGMTMGAMANRLPELFDLIFGVISENGGKTHEFCPYCGEEMKEGNYKRCNVQGNTITMDIGCVDKINSEIAKENAEFDAAPNNYLRGTIGAVIGGVVGAVVEVLLMMIGRVACLSAIVSVVLGAFLYKKFGGKPNKIMLVIVGVVTLVFMVATVFVVYSVLVGPVEYYITSTEFTLDIVLVLVFSVIGIVCEMVALARSIKRNDGIK